jgi:diphosphomevalonate decarboxylase
MPDLTAKAVSCPNIAFIKYWGNRDDSLRLPANGSISMNLDGLCTITRVTFDPGLTVDQLTLNGRAAAEPACRRVQGFLDLVRKMAGIPLFARVDSHSNFPTGAGIASSASAFAALGLAATAAIGLPLSANELSRLARRGSGSASRSIPAGFVEWQAGSRDEDSYAVSIAPPDYWDLVDCIAVVSQAHKGTTSSEGHRTASSSPLQAARVADAPRRLDLCRRAIQERDFTSLAAIMELDSNLMHAVMTTSKPSLVYYQPATLAVIHAVHQWQAEGLPVGYTIDAGPNVHVITLSKYAGQVSALVQALPEVERVICAGPGGPARLVQEDDRIMDDPVSCPS